LPSRNPGGRPDGYKLELRNGWRAWKQKVKLAEHPGVVRFLIFSEPPGRVIGKPSIQPTFSIRPVDVEIFPDTAVRLARLGATSVVDTATLNAMMLARFIAKIGHAFAIAELGLDSFEQFYVSSLIRSEVKDWNYSVGGYDAGCDVCATHLHELKFLRRGDDLSVVIHLFAPYCSRFGYEVVVGRLAGNTTIPDVPSCC
jgi:hypothetical protein